MSVTIAAGLELGGVYINTRPLPYLALGAASCNSTELQVASCCHGAASCNSTEHPLYKVKSTQ